MLSAFRRFDKDGGGTISAEEVAEALGHDMASEEKVWTDVIAEVDTNNDGQIDFKEFKLMMRKLMIR